MCLDSTKRNSERTSLMFVWETKVHAFIFYIIFIVFSLHQLKLDLPSSKWHKQNQL